MPELIEALEGREEMRHATRRPMAVQVGLTVPGGLPRTYLTHDVGPRGLFLRTHEPLKVGTKVHLVFALPRCAMCSVEGEVAWTTRERPAGDKIGMGIRFTHVHNLEGEILRGFFGLDRTSGRRVLVIEDDPTLRSRLAAGYRREGLEVVEAPWKEGEALLGNAHALAVVGVDLPGWYERVKAARRGAKAPVVALLSGKGVWEEWIGKDTLFCLAKPADPSRVVQMSLCLVK